MRWNHARYILHLSRHRGAGTGERFSSTLGLANTAQTPEPASLGLLGAGLLGLSALRRRR